MYDYLIVGSGLFGSVFARQMTDQGARCLVIEKREHIGGNCYTKNDDGIAVHEYGPHIFHTNSDRVWKYVNKYAEFNRFSYRPKVRHGEGTYSFPINMMTLHQLWGVNDISSAREMLDSKRVDIKDPENLEEWALSQVGREIYEKFIYGYTKKQWGREPRDLPSSIIKRIPIRLTWNDDYFDDRYQGIPIGGYTQIFDRLLRGVDVETGVDFISNKSDLECAAKKVVYTGALDELYGYELGELEWRSLKFDHQRLDTPDCQGNAAINYTSEDVPYTRAIEHKHFEFGKQDHTVITFEYPQKWDRSKEKYYPIDDGCNRSLYRSYRDMAEKDKYIIGGRLADYKYYDMHQVIGSALSKSEKEINDA